MGGRDVSASGLLLPGIDARGLLPGIDVEDIQLPHAPIVRDVGFLIRKVGRRQPAVA